MLRLHPSTIILTHDEIHRDIEKHLHKLHPISQPAPPITWGYPNSSQGNNNKGKQPARSHPSMLSGHHAIVAALQGLSLGAANPAEGVNTDYVGHSNEYVHDGDREASADFFPMTSILTDNFDGEGGSDNATAAASMTTTTVPTTPGGSGVGRIRRWISRTPADEDLRGRHANVNWNLDNYEDEWRYESDAESQVTDYIVDEEDDNSAIFSTEGDGMVPEPLIPNPGDAFRTLSHRQLDGAAETDSEDDGGGNMMMETPHRSGIASPNSDYDPRARSPSNWLSNNTVHREFVDDVFAYLNGSSGIRSPITRNTSGFDMGVRASNPFGQASTAGPSVFALGHVGHPMHRYLAESSRRSLRAHDQDAEIDPEDYPEESDDDIPAEHLAMLAERKSRMQVEAARRIIR